MKIIIGAMQEELQALVKDIDAKKVEGSIINEFYSEKYNTVVAWTGIGISNAAIGLSHLLTKYDNVEYIINAGTSGCLDKSLVRGDFVVVDKAIYSTSDSTGFGYEYGQLPSMPAYYESNMEIRNKIINVINDKKYIVGNTATSDMFFESFDKVENYVNKINHTMVIAEMECASYFQTAYLYKKPIAAIKIVSDVIGEPNPNEEQFDKFLPKAAKELSELIRKII